MILKLRRRFIAAAMISVIAVLLILMGTINYINYRNVLESSDRILTMLAENDGEFPGDTESDGEFPGDVKPDNEVPPDERPNNTGFSLFETGKDGKNLSAETRFESRYFSVEVLEDGTYGTINLNQVAAIDASTAKEYTSNAMDSLEGESDKVFIEDYRCTSIATESVQMYIFLDCSRTLQNFRDFLQTTVIVSLIGTAIVFLLIVIFSKIITRPVAESYEKQKRFITDAGHEIKTPLTIINADVAVMEMEIDGEEIPWLEDIKSQVGRLTELTNDLVYLSKMDESHEVIGVDFSFSEVAAELAGAFDSRAVVDHLTYEYHIGQNLRVHGDESAIRKLISILLDNAFKYCDANGIIRLDAYRRGKNLVFTVYNTTDRISADDVTHLFDRFYRTDISRNSETGGHGIGLSIAQAVVGAHGGKIVASTDDEKSLMITVTLPAI